MYLIYPYIYEAEAMAVYIVDEAAGMDETSMKQHCDQDIIMSEESGMTAS